MTLDQFTLTALVAAITAGVISYVCGEIHDRRRSAFLASLDHRYDSGLRLPRPDPIFDDIADLFGFVAIIGGIALLVAGLIYGGSYLDRVDCRNKAERLGVAYDHDRLSGCFFQMADGTFVPASAWRATEDSDR